MHRISRTALILGLLGSILLLVAGALGAYHPLGDSLSIFRITAFGGIIFTSGLLAFDRIGWIYFGFVAGLALASHYAARYDFIKPDGSEFRLYQKNLSFRMQNADALIADILSSKPDFVTFQEVTKRNRELLMPLASEYPTVHWCPFSHVGGVAVFSRFPAIEGARVCIEGSGTASIQIETNKGAMWITSAHVHWPYPFGQMLQVERVVPELGKLEGPHVIGGDFNMVPWGHSVARLKSLGLKRLSKTRTTFRIENVVPISIDHVLGSFDRVSTETRPYFGSDHYGLLVSFRLH